MKITVNQIEEVLEKNYQDYLQNKKAKNLMFVGLTCIGKNSVIQKWMGKHNDVTLQRFCYPEPVMKKNKQGNYEKSSIYIIHPNILDDISKNKTILYCQRINFGRDASGDEELVKLIKDSKYIDFEGYEYDLSARMFTIATAYPDHQGNHNVALLNELTSLFEIYEVEVDYDETINYFKEYYENIVDNIKRKNTRDEYDKEDLCEIENTRLSIIYSLLENKTLIELSERCNPKTIEQCLVLAKDKDDFFKILNEQIHFFDKWK